MRPGSIIKAFFFDLDDTLVGTRQANFLAYRQALGEAGIDFTYRDFLKTWGKDSRHFIPELAPHLSPLEVDEVRAKKSSLYPTYLPHSVPNTALINFLHAMAPYNQMALVTTAKRKNCSQVLEHHGLQNAFDLIICGDDVKNGKPDPEPYLLALEKTGLKPPEVIAFEDSGHGIAAAQAAGISVVRVREFLGEDA